MYNLIFIRRSLYRLKLRYGQPMSITVKLSQATDVETGDQTNSSTTFSIHRAIVLPNVFKRDFDYDLSYLAANKNFTYGGFFDAGTRTLLVDRNDLPSTYVPNLNHTITFDSRIYKIVKFEDYEHKQALIFIIKELEGES